MKTGATSEMTVVQQDIPQNGHDQDWLHTIRKLMQQAKEANDAFEYDNAIEYLNRLEDIWDSKGIPDLSVGLRIELYREKAKAYASRGESEIAIIEYRKVLDYCRDASLLPIKAETHTQIGQLLSKQGDHDRALGYIQRAISSYRRLGDSAGLCKGLRNLGVVFVELGEFEEAITTIDEAIDVARQIGDIIVYADLVNNLGAVHNMQGNRERALELYQESLEIYERENERRKEAYTKNNIAISLIERGDEGDAFQYLVDAYFTATDIKDTALCLILDINLADLYVKKQVLDQARAHIDKALHHLRDRYAANGHLVEAKKIAGKITCLEGDTKRALKYFDEALDLSRDLGAQFLEAEVLLERGTLLKQVERHFDALTDLETSYQIYTRLLVEGKREQTEKTIGSIEHLYLQIFDTLAEQVDQKDEYTKCHSDRVASLGLILAKELGLQPHMLKTIVAAGLLHDIGKIRIDDTILKKAGTLSDPEFAEIKRHPEHGLELLRGKEFPWDVKPMILSHHEKFDGRGYPHGIKGEDIPLGARIICIVDVFDALTSDRVYRKAYSVSEALEVMIGESGTSFDPVLLKCFVTVVKAGKVDTVINRRTDGQALSQIWSQCMDG
jgi:putative nucleotidyltransferase with HDIG domain